MSGKIYLVGFGPGSEEHMSYKAKSAIAESDVVIGYTTYIKLVKDLLDGKEIIKKGMTEEIDRCIEAYEQAKLGKVVSLISSGDIGVYGMAGPTYEVLLQAGWTPNDEIQVEIVPGSTALSACASLVGAPLTHDFCSISLSDLLTPWPVIARRIEAAGNADFVLALYNPKSGRRTQQIVQAQEILLRYRKPDTPVAIVKSAYRRRQSVQLVRLDEMAECDIGMLTTVLIGNSSTFIKAGLMITPRGYANKYNSLTGATKEGEQAGVSLSMGLEGWYACLRQYVQDNPGLTLEKIADYFGVVMGEVLAAIAAGESAGEHKAVLVAQDKLNDVVSACQSWGRLRGIIRAEAGAVSELFLQAQDFQLRGDWLNIETDAFHCHINWSKVAAAYLASRDNKSYGVNFIDNKGHLVFRLLMMKEKGEFSANQLATYTQTWQALVGGIKQ
ncbi:precorrin-3B C(17)-methyltransferase [methanotrophic endosymbiont of Bathymodiolus puteoserpentis (Logatchev)]|jgi:precorrin-3B C17-methyltransferase|uniref:precorrin-3B C(17)-methyltransferase n=1 Tax=methanotrophic endosymbiont of Bathymodiolus puteoserpentis (Logatchev) TaxID=343235 RepID=UPI0013CD0523|nr:precorrin-3B C(17)-methyltransferase [methanotrophic endosymbiont of Bathymodiolus puteoserpentis (Logatchev)]SHE23036.1 Cobalt-precorrin-3b C17-methyltransferase [methanotrophic endosymbiont of Bathymodiolus puteoserpentis (Logatchev)]